MPSSQHSHHLSLPVSGHHEHSGSRSADRLRPPTSRHHSSASVNSVASTLSRRPQPQQKEFVPTAAGVSAIVGGASDGGDGFAERYLFEEAVAEAEAQDVKHDHGHDHGHDEDSSPQYEEHEHGHGHEHHHHHHHHHDSTSPSHFPSDSDGGDDWATARDGSISRRPAWRRPSPLWIYPFIVGATLSLGMCMAPKSELFINLACLAHPPQLPSSSQPAEVSHLAIKSIGDEGWSYTAQHVDTGIWNGDIAPSINASLPITPAPAPVPAPSKRPMSAADEWFYKLQREIYEYNLKKNHQNGPNVSIPVPTPTSTTLVALPTGPLPHPSPPVGDRPMEAPVSQPGSGDQQPERPPPPPGQADSPFHAIDPVLCKKDPKVQATAARLTMIITVTTGILSALTTGYWGLTSDRIGRTKVMAIVMCGLLLNEACFILVATFPHRAPGGYRALLIGPALDGMLGGFSTISATINAYMSDVTPDGSRAAAFARLGGIAMTGMAFGPMLGSAVIRMTGNIMSPFYFAICVHLFFIVMILFLLPESLSSDARKILAKNATLSKEAAKRRDEAERQWEDQTPALERTDPLLGESGWSRVSFAHAGHSRRRKRLVGRSIRVLRAATKFLQPLSVFLPTENPDGGKNWQLTYTALGMFSLSLMYGIMSVKTQFTFYAFGWTSAQLGPYMSLMGFARGFVMIILLPGVLRLARPYFDGPTPSKQAADPGASAISTATAASAGVSGVSTAGSSSSSTSILAPPPPARRSSRLDLITIRVSLLIECLLYFALALGPSPPIFVCLTVGITLGSGYNPAANSLALSFLPSAREAGRLFGGVSVLHALSSLTSPLLFGTLFSYTVGWYAPTVFALAGAILVFSQIAFAFVRIPGDDTVRKAERGRSRAVKRVKSSAGSR